MPELARFHGIVIRLFYADHPPPHHAAFAAPYAGDAGALDTLA